MAWDTEGTKRKILRAAADEFAAHGPDGTTIERIAKAAGVNKERVYNYFGAKRELFAYVLREEMAEVARAVPIGSFAKDDVGEYAGRVYDYHREHPELNRLLLWEGLVLGTDIPSDDDRLARYREKTSAVAEGQGRGYVTEAIDADHLAFLILSLAGWWSAVPQVAEMIAKPIDEEEHGRRRASVIEAAKRLAAPDDPGHLGG
jgi:transcriptional regulator, TetR family